MERIPYNLHANLPPASHMIHLILIAGSGGDSVQLFHFVVFLFALVAARELVTSRLAWLCACLIFLLIPQVSLLFSLTNIDFLTTLFCVASFLIARRIANGSAGSGLLALHLAFLLSLKYQSMIFVLLILVYLLYRRKYRAWVLSTALTLILISPFLIKNYAF